VIPDAKDIQEAFAMWNELGEKAAQEFVKNLQDWASTTGAA